MSNLFNNPDNLVDVVRQILSGKPLEEKKKEEAPKKVIKEKISIQERIFAQAVIMFEPIDIWLDKWYDEQEKFNPKSFDFGKHLRQMIFFHHMMRGYRPCKV